MKKLIATLLVGGLAALVVVGFGPTPTSEPPKPGPGTTTTTTTTSKETKGKVTASKEGKITVKTDAGDKDFTIPDSAKVTIDGAAGKAADIKTDSTVTVTEKDSKVTDVDVKTK